MPTITASPPGRWRAYHRVTRTATYGFLSALPLLLLYEVAIVAANAGSVAQIRVGAEVWLKQLLLWLGGSGLAVLGGVVLAVGVAVFLLERKKRIPLRPVYFGWIVVESGIYAVVLAFLISWTVGALFALAPAAPGGGSPIEMGGVGLQLALSIGAGLYEELVFRVLLVGGLFALLRRFTPSGTAAYLVAAIVGALLFSAVHYIGALGDLFTLSSFVFRFLFGLALNALFLVRGFGVAAWTHALYDVFVTTMMVFAA